MPPSFLSQQSLSPEEQRLFRLYGKLPSRSDHFAKHLKDRKYFDSGDYAMNKAGKGDGIDTGAMGSQHPVPEKIPHLTSPANGSGGGSAIPKHVHPGAQAGSPVKESSYLNRETSAEGRSSGPRRRRMLLLMFSTLLPPRRSVSPLPRTLNERILQKTNNNQNKV
ncbi:mRNA stability protein [Cladobotryum mycophilum]|uniref:mRNA stability protein n=1 Tax=Cladobotryum mycophilum TaxID=491253 RepID=A0ABR0S785_9HYPO